MRPEEVAEKGRHLGFCIFDYHRLSLWWDDHYSKGASYENLWVIVIDALEHSKDRDEFFAFLESKVVIDEKAAEQ